MNGINTWWKDLPGERYWLGVTGSDDRGELLAVPAGSPDHSPRSDHPLLAHVREGDAVFHYDQLQEAIVAWSTPRGRVRQRRLYWSVPTASAAPDLVPPQRLTSRSVGLEAVNRLEDSVPLELIARTQWTLFPELRAFEDKVGDPLYYPFEMGSPSETSLLPGYVFKLPALFVESFFALALVARQVPWAGEARAQAVAPSRAVAGPREAPWSGAPRATVAFATRPGSR